MPQSQQSPPPPPLHPLYTPPNNGQKNPAAPRPHPHLIGGGLVDSQIDTTGIVCTGKELKEKRRQRGNCEYCGLVKTHNVWGKKLTIPKKVYRGYCLKCYDEKEVRLFFEGEKDESEEEEKNIDAPTSCQHASAAAGDDADENAGATTDQPPRRKPRSFKKIFVFSKSHPDGNNHNESDDTSERSRTTEVHDDVDDDQNDHDDDSSMVCVTDPKSAESKKASACVTEEEQDQKPAAVTKSSSKKKLLLRGLGKPKKSKSNGRRSFNTGEAAQHLLPVSVRTSSLEGIANEANNKKGHNSSSSFDKVPSSSLSQNPSDIEGQSMDFSSISTLGEFEPFRNSKNMQEQEHEQENVKASSERTPCTRRRLLGIWNNYSGKSEPTVLKDSVGSSGDISTQELNAFESPGAKSLPEKMFRKGSKAIESFDNFPSFPDFAVNDFGEEERADRSLSNDEAFDEYYERDDHDKNNVYEVDKSDENDDHCKKDIYNKVDHDRREKDSNDDEDDDGSKEDDDSEGVLETDDERNDIASKATGTSSYSSSSLPSLQSSSKSSSTSSSPSVATTKKVITPTEKEEAVIAIISRQIEENNFGGALETIRKHVHSPSVVQFGLSTFRCKIPQAYAQVTQAKSLFSSSIATEDKTEEQVIQPHDLLPPLWIKIIAASIMYCYKTKPLIQSEAIQTIWVISSLNARYKRDVIMDGGVDAVIEALNNFSKHIDVVEYGAGFLSCLLCDNDERNRISVVRCIQAKSFESRLLKLLERFATQDGGVEEWIVRVLYGFFLSPVDSTGNNFKHLLEKEKNAKRKKKERWRNLPGTILGVMSMHKTNPEIQVWSCRLMWILLEELTTDEAKKKRLRPQDCRTPPEQDGTATTAILGTLVFHDFLDAISVVADAMTSYKDDATLHEVACGFFHLLTKVFSSSLVGDCAKMISSSLPISSVQIQTITESAVNSMVNFPTSSTLQIYGCSIISNLCSCTCGDTAKDACAIIVQLGGVSSILQSMQFHSENMSLQAESCGAIASLCGEAPLIIDSILDLNGVDVVVNALRLHKRDTLSDEDRLYFMEQVCAMIAALSANAKCIVTAKLFSEIVDDLFSVISSNGNVGTCILERLMMITTNLISDSGDENNTLATAAVSLAVEMMKTSTNEDGLVYAIKFLHFIASSMDCCVDAILSGGVREQIINSMQYNPGSAVIQESSCCLLSLIYAKVNGGAISALETTDEIVAVRNAMRAHQTHPTLQGAACLALRNFCSALGNSNDRIVAELFESMNDVVQASRTHSKSPFVQENVCGALWAFSTISDTMALSVASSGGIQLIIEAMNEFPKLLALQNDACNALLILTAQEENFEAIGTERGIDAIVHCFNQFDDDMAMSEKVCSIIAALSHDEYKVKLTIIEHEIAVNRVIESMFRFPHSAYIQMAGSEIIANISVDEDIISDIAGLAGIDSLTTAMMQHLDTPLVQEKACEAMAILIPGVDNRILMGNSVGKWIVNSMNRYPENAKIQSKGICALCSLSKKSKRNKEAVAQLDGIRVIINSMMNHLASSVVQEKGVIALCSLGVLDANQVTIGDSGGVQAIINGMKEHRSSEKLQIGALEALSRLAPINANKERIASSGGVDSIVETMWVYNANESIQRNALATLSSINAESQNQEVRIMTTAELDAVVNAMKNFQQSEKVQLNACKLLQNYTLAAANVELMRQNELLPMLLQSAATNFPRIGEQAQYLIDLF